MGFHSDEIQVQQRQGGGSYIDDIGLLKGKSQQAVPLSSKKQAVAGRPNIFLQIGVRGRKTGWLQKRNVKRDSDGMDNIDDFFASDDEDRSEQKRSSGSGRKSVSSSGRVLTDSFVSNRPPLAYTNNSNSSSRKSSSSVVATFPPTGSRRASNAMYEKRGLLDEDLWNEPVEYIQQQHQDYPSSYHQPREYPARERIMMDYDAPRPSSGRYVPTRYERMMMLEQEAADEAAEREMMMYRRRSRSVGRSAIYPPVMMSRGNLASSDYDEEYPARYTPSSQAALRRRSQSVGAINRIQPSLPPHHLQQQYYEDDVPVPAQRRLYSQHTPSRYEHLQQQQQLQRDPSIYQRRDKRRSSIPIIASNYAASPEVDEEEQHEFNSRAQSLGRVGGATSTSRRSSIKPVGANIRNQSYEEHLELQQQEAPRRKSSTTTTRKLAAQTKKQATQSSATRKSASASLSSSSFASSSSAKAVYIDNQDEEIFGVVDEIHQQQQDDDEVDDDVLSAVNEDSFDEVDRVEYVDEDVSFTRHPKQSGGVAQEDQVLAPPSSLLAAATSLSSSFSSSTSIGRKSMDKQQDIYDFPDVDNDDDQIVNDLGHVSDGSGVFDDAAPQMEEFNSNNSLVHGNDDDEAGGNEEEGLAAVVAPKRRGRKPGIKTKSTASRKKKNAPAPKYVEYTEDYDDEQNSQDEAERAQLMTQRALLKKKQIQDGSMVTVGKFEQPAVPDDDDGTRRSRRARTKPIQWWETEKVMKRGDTLEIVRLVPDEDVIKKEITSYRRPMKKKRTGSSANYKKRTRQIEEDEEGIHFSEEEGEDGKSKSLQSILVKDIATNTMVEKELFVSQSMVDWQESSEGCEYAKTQDFVESGASTGFISLKPGGEKPNKNTKANTLTFVVITGKVEVKIEKSSVVVGVGTQFSVPAGNQYRLINTGDKTCRIFWMCLSPQ